MNILQASIATLVAPFLEAKIYLYSSEVAFGDSK
jgi:hypothetical protein